MRALRSALVALTLLAAAPVCAQDIVTTEVVTTNSLSLSVFLSTLLYGAVGILFTLAGYFVFDKVVGLNLRTSWWRTRTWRSGSCWRVCLSGCSIVVAAVMLS